MAEVFAIIDRMRYNVLAVTITEKQAYTFCTKYLEQSGYSPDEIHEEMEELRQEGCIEILAVEKVPFSDGFYRAGHFDGATWIPPKFTED
jgi:hypothetical protein